MDKIFKSLNSINSFSSKIILYGCVFVLAFCIVGAVLIGYNQLFTQEIGLYELGVNLIQTSTTVFAQIVIGGLAIDLFNTFAHND